MTGVRPQLEEPYEPWEDLEPRIRFSLEEWIHLGGSVAVLGVAFAFALTQQGYFAGGVDLARIVGILPYSLAIVVTAFVLHELAHKVAAQRRHMEAEFRASPGGLLMGLIMSVSTGFVLAAPGAVVIYADHATKRDSGIISIVGPMVNLAIGYAAIPFAYYWGEPIAVGDLNNLFEVVVLVNAFLALFNMLPIPPLDGSKIIRWNIPAYGLMMVLTLFLMAVGVLGPTVLGL